jgi:hypothetical protein
MSFECLGVAAIYGFVALCITIGLNVAINLIVPVRVPLWSTTILSLVVVAYWFTGSFAERRIINILQRRPQLAASGEDPKFPIGDPKRNLCQHFDTLKEASAWIDQQAEYGGINFKIRDDHVTERPLYRPWPKTLFTRVRFKLTIAYLLRVVILAAIVKLFVESAFPDQKLPAPRSVYGRFPFWASMILTWVFLAHAELRDISARKGDRLS